MAAKELKKGTFAEMLDLSEITTLIEKHELPDIVEQLIEAHGMPELLRRIGEFHDKKMKAPEEKK
jgi:hypothetical protein